MPYDSTPPPVNEVQLTRAERVELLRVHLAELAARNRATDVEHPPLVLKTGLPGNTGLQRSMLTACERCGLFHLEGVEATHVGKLCALCEAQAPLEAYKVVVRNGRVLFKRGRPKNDATWSFAAFCVALFMIGLMSAHTLADLIYAERAPKVKVLEPMILEGVVPAPVVEKPRKRRQR